MSGSLPISPGLSEAELAKQRFEDTWHNIRKRIKERNGLRPSNAYGNGTKASRLKRQLWAVEFRSQLSPRQLKRSYTSKRGRAIPQLAAQVGKMRTAT